MAAGAPLLWVGTAADGPPGRRATEAGEAWLRRHRHQRRRVAPVYCPLASWRLYSVSVDALSGRTVSDAEAARTVVDEGDKGGGADGLESDAAGRIYATSYEHDAVVRRTPEGLWETVASCHTYGAT